MRGTPGGAAPSHGGVRPGVQPRRLSGAAQGREPEAWGVNQDPQRGGTGQSAWLWSSVERLSRACAPPASICKHHEPQL